MLATVPVRDLALQAVDQLPVTRVALIADFLEEGWPSMDLAVEVLERRLGHEPLGDIQAQCLRPTLARRFAHLPGFGRSTRAGTLDRLINRFWDYPAWLRHGPLTHDVFHVVDHSYAHLVHVLPAMRTVVTCHDIDTFLPLVQPSQATTSLPRPLARRILSGLRSACRVVCVSEATRNELIQHRLVEPTRTVVVPNGIDPVFATIPGRQAEQRIRELIPHSDGPTLLHVGTTIPRKRIDRLLEIFACVRAEKPKARLLKAGGTFTADQRQRLHSLGLADAVIELPFLQREELAALYRSASVVLITSDREGFGLPVIESLATGTAVVAGDLAVFREVGGEVVRLVDVDDVREWTEAVIDAIDTDASELATSARQRRIAHAAQFSWDRHASGMADVYRAVAGGTSAIVQRETDQTS